MQRLFPLTLFLAAAFATPAAPPFVTPALAEDTITVGFTASQTGPLNIDSLGLVRGYELWRDEVNAAGGIKAGGKSIRSISSAMTINRSAAAYSSFTRASSTRTARNFCSARIRPA